MAFHDVQFPEGVSFGCSGGPMYSTIVVETDSGAEQRIGRWDTPRMRWEVTRPVWNQTTLEEVLAFFRARRGRLHSFRFRDWADYTAGMDLGPSGRVDGTPNVFATGDGVEDVFQLRKSYTSGSQTEYRTVTLPRATGFKLYVNGVLKTITTDYAIVWATGVITFTSPPANGHAISWIGYYDVPARFDQDEMRVSLAGVARGEWPNVSVVEVR